MQLLRRGLQRFLSRRSRQSCEQLRQHQTTPGGASTGSGSGGGGALQKVRDWHSNAFSNKFLLLTNVGISLSLSSVGDMMEQQLEIYNGEIEEFDSTRTCHMATSGVTVGIICHYWYQLLDKRLPGRSMRVVAKKIVLDQLICSPVYITAFFVTLGLLEHKDSREVWEEIKEKAWRLYAAEWTVWPVAQFVNFYWISPKYRIFYDNVISLGYDVYTSKVKHMASSGSSAAASAVSSVASSAASSATAKVKQLL